uniref:NDR1/HIN1-like protein 2 n=1 Tax=Elaeis guineensis var. tenera TaxID=51953 RepID=A0A6I9Q8W8_ELAGV|nr:NDR1/HIN1-like protein 2 [Elaeis guineensis]
MPAAVHPAPQPSETLPAANAILRNHRRCTPSLKAPSCAQICCTTCCLLVLGFIAFLVLLIIDSAGSSHPKISIDRIAAVGLNTTPGLTLSPHFNVTVRVKNTSKFFFRDCYSYGYAAISYSGVTVGEGLLPVFCQGPKKSTVLETVLRGSDIVLADGVRDRLADDQRRGEVAMEVAMKLPTPYQSKFVEVNAWCQVVVGPKFRSTPCSVKK